MLDGSLPCCLLPCSPLAPFHATASYAATLSVQMKNNLKAARSLLTAIQKV